MNKSLIRIARRVAFGISIGSLMSLCAMAETYTGVISDSRCGAKHSAASAEDVQCMKACIKRGATPVLLTGDKVYNISSASNDMVASHVGEKVKVTGKVEKDRSGEILTIEAISKAE